MEKLKNKEIFGRFIVAALVAYFIFKYNYEVTQFIYSSRDVIFSIRDAISVSLERTFDDAGIIVAFLLLIVLLLWLIIQLILLLIGGLLVWVIVTLNDAYILPFLIPLLIVYSKFSYSFVAKPILWPPQKVFSLLAKLGIFLLRMSNLFLILPIAEVISLKVSPGRKVYKIGLSLLFVLGLCGVVIGGTGVVVKVIQDKKLISDMNLFVSNNIAGLFEKTSYENIQHQAIVMAVAPNWTATSIQLMKGDFVSFTATGLVRCPSPFKRGYYTGSPDGIEDAINLSGYVTPSRLTKSYRQKGFSPSYYILPAEPINRLMGKVGTGEAFAIGSSETYKVKQDGELFLGINQLWKVGAWKNNAGQLNIDLVIRRKV